MNKVLGVLAALTLCAAAPAGAAPPKPPPPVQWAWDHVARVVIIGDLHGDYTKFHDQLTQAGLIDAKDRWIGGKTHLVQLGDVPDRAPDTRKILDLLIKLEPQARKAGGFVHALIGNHEAMNMEGDLRYTTPGEFAAFVDRNSAKRRDAYYAKVVEALTKTPPATGPITFDAAYRQKFDDEHPLGWVEHAIAWSPGGVYGKWILTHSAVIRIDDALYLHAGISPAFTPFEPETMNAAVIKALNHQPPAEGGPPDILWNDLGPLWYRGMALAEEPAEAPSVAAVLARYHVAHVIVGHTKRYSMVNSRFDGAVIMTDIGVPARCADPHGFLIKEGDKLTAWHRGHAVPLRVSGDAHKAYLADIAAIDAAAGACPPAAPTPSAAPPPG